MVSVHTSARGDTISIHVPFGAEIAPDLLNSVLSEAAGGVDYGMFLNRDTSDSIRLDITSHFSILENVPYRAISMMSDGFTLDLTFALDVERIATYARRLTTPPEVVTLTPVAAVNSDLLTSDSFEYIRDGIFLYPCSGIPYPENANLLPNAPRTYRSGTHRGIDFPAPYGSEIRSVADGVVIRADNHYTEVTNQFRESLLKKASAIGRTPSDVFEHILFGRSVFIDHGVEMLMGKRLVSIYAHLSDIADGIEVGTRLVRGQVLGTVGNSGTSDGADGNRKGAHLHFELIIQDQTGERYMGQGLAYEPLTQLLDRVFVSE